MSTTNTANTANTIFDGIHVSKGFVRGLQGQVLKLEQVQQSLIRQLEHANKLASEYHANSILYRRNYNQALHEIDEMKQKLEIETMLRINREQDLEHLKTLMQEQLTFTSNSGSSSPSPSPSPYHPHRDDIESLDHPREPMSPVSIPSTPRKSTAAATATATATTLSAHDHECIKKQLLIEADTTPFNENDERVVMRDGKRMKQWVQFGFGNTPLYGEREMTMSENEEYDEGGDQDDQSQSQSQSQSQEYDEGGNDYYPNDAYSSQTTDCTGDTIFHSDSD
jgi:hypothetical protein